MATRVSRSSVVRALPWLGPVIGAAALLLAWPDGGEFVFAVFFPFGFLVGMLAAGVAGADDVSAGVYVSIVVFSCAQALCYRWCILRWLARGWRAALPLGCLLVIHAGMVAFIFCIAHTVSEGVASVWN